jgi:hypothetical protein
MTMQRSSFESHGLERIPPEKDQAVHAEWSRGVITQEDIDFVANFPNDRKKKILRKVDVSQVCTSVE